MADLDTLTLAVETTAGDADDALKRVSDSLKSLGAALQNVDTKGLAEIARGMKQISKSSEQSGLKKAASDMKKQVSVIAGLKKRLDFTKNFAGGAFTGAKNTITSIGTAVGKLSKTFGVGAITSNKFLSSLIRIAGYRMVRTILSSITKGTAAGLEHLARASSEANATLTQLSSGALTLQNAMGGALYSVLASIIGVLNTIVNAAVAAINWISMLFAILGGRGTFQKATSSTKEYASALGGAAGGAKALKQELMGFDEINSMSPDAGGGGGGGGAGMLDYGSMFEEVPVSDSLKEMVDKADFTLLGESLANKMNAALSKIDWSKIRNGAYKFARSLVTFLNGFIETVDAAEVGDAIQGIVNSGLTFVNTFMYDTNWELLGNKIKLAITTAIFNIKPADVGKAFRAKFNALINFLKGLIPKTPEEWKQITDWVADCINASIDSITPEDVGDVVSRVVTGGLQAIISLGEAGVFSNIAEAVFTAIETAVKSINKDDIERAVTTLLKEAWNIIKLTFSLAIEIGDLLPAKMITGYALYRTIAPALKAAGVTGYQAIGKNLKITGSILLAMDIAAGINDVVADAKAGNGVDLNKICDIVSDALVLGGLNVFSASPLAGGILVGAGLVIKLFTSIELDTKPEEMAQIAAVFGDKMTSAISSATDLTDLKAVFDQFSGVDIDLTQFETMLRVMGGIKSETPTLVEYRDAFVNLFSAFSDLNLEGEMSSVSQFFTEILDTMGSVETETGAAETAASGLATAAEATTAATEGMATATEGIVKAAGDISGAATDISALDSTMQATGEQADELKTKIVSIPSDIVFNLTLNNYEAVMNQIDALKEQMTSVANINWFGMGNQAMTAFKRGLKSVKMPTISVSWKTSTKTASFLGEEYTVSVPTPTIKLYAQGGFPDAGELFMANENGVQELVGRVGNKPAVANQDQIGDAIFKYMDAHDREGGGTDYNAMANALVGAMKSAGLGALYLDGKMIKNSLNKEAQRSGRPALGY